MEGLQNVTAEALTRRLYRAVERSLIALLKRLINAFIERPNMRLANIQKARLKNVGWQGLKIDQNSTFPFYRILSPQPILHTKVGR
jgi:hypothetical protein